MPILKTKNSQIFVTLIKTLQVGLLINDALEILLNELLKFHTLAQHVLSFIYFLCLFVYLGYSVDHFC